MERESFEDEETAELLNDNFIYMSFVQATTGAGGWPLNVFLTPSLQPFFGGTYFPPEDQRGMPSFKTTLKQMMKLWKDKPEMIQERALTMLSALKTGISDSLVATEYGFSDKEVSEVIKKVFMLQRGRFDSKLGGFGNAPKFPRPVDMDILLRIHSKTSDSVPSEVKQDALRMVTFSLEKMSNGGIYDHLGGGFHGCSEDEYWHVPQYEKMLYDNAQLVQTFSNAYRYSKNESFRTVVAETVEYLRRDLLLKGGGFCSSEDADSFQDEKADQKKAGAFYIWSRKEIEDKVANEIYSDIFCHYYFVQHTTNATLSARSDPRGELKGYNVLIALHTDQVKATADDLKISEEEVKVALSNAKDILFKTRCSRQRPFLDDTVITAWNGLTISALSLAYQVFQVAFPPENASQVSYLELAQESARFIRKNMVNSEGHLYRSYREGVSKVSGLLKDYAFLIRGLLHLYEASTNSEWLMWAYELQETQDSLFWDDIGGGYFDTSGKDTSILFRTKDDYDGSEPSPNSVSALNLLKLSCFFDKKEWESKALKTLLVLKARLIEAPHAIPLSCVALDALHTPYRQFVLVGDKSTEEYRKFVQEIFRKADNLENTIVIYSDDSDGFNFLREKNAAVGLMKAIDGKATLYVCENYTCKAPITNPEEFGKVGDMDFN